MSLAVGWIVFIVCGFVLASVVALRILCRSEMLPQERAEYEANRQEEGRVDTI